MANLNKIQIDSKDYHDVINFDTELYVFIGVFAYCVAVVSRETTGRGGFF